MVYAGGREPNFLCHKNSAISVCYFSRKNNNLKKTQINKQLLPQINQHPPPHPRNICKSIIPKFSSHIRVLKIYFHHLEMFPYISFDLLSFLSWFGTSCPERLCSPHPWKLLRPDWIKPWANLVWSQSWPFFE